jgi:hypothetical protein
MFVQVKTKDFSKPFYYIAFEETMIQLPCIVDDTMIQLPLYKN